MIDRLQRLLEGRLAPGVDLPQVDVVALQPPQRSLKIAKQARRDVSTMRLPSLITNPAFVQ